MRCHRNGTFVILTYAGQKVYADDTLRMAISETSFIEKFHLVRKEVFIVLEYLTETRWLAGNCIK